MIVIKDESDYQSKLAKGRKKSAYISIEKSETTTSVYANFQLEKSFIKEKLFERKTYGSMILLTFLQGKTKGLMQINLE